MTLSRASRLLAASAPLLVALLIVKLWLTGTLGYYVNDRTVWIVLLGGGLFSVVGAISLRAALQHHADEARFSWKTVVFVVPVLIGLIVPAQPLSASSSQSSSLGALQLTSHISAGSPGDAFGYWIGSVGQHADAGWWKGQHVTLVGFVAKQPGLPSRAFIIGRYLVTCCVVDATLYGFPVRLAAGAVPSEGTWIQVSGVFGGRFWTDPSGSQWPLIERARMVPALIPASPYLSP